MRVVDLLLFFYTALLPSVTQAMNRKDETLNLSRATLYAIRERISKLSTTVVIREQHSLVQTAHINGDLMDYVLSNLGETISVQFYIARWKDQHRKFNVLIVDSDSALGSILVWFPFSQGGLRILIILTQYTSNALFQIFVRCFMHGIIDCNVIVSHPTLGTCMYTYELYSKDACRAILPVLYFRFNHESEDLKNIFPDKLNNFHGCPVTVAGRFFEPMLRFVGNMSNPQPMGDWENLSGIEGLLLKQMAKALNFTIKLSPFDEDKSYFYKDKQSTEGFIEFLEVAIGGLSISEVQHSAFSTTIAYYHSPYVYVVRGGRGLSSLGRLAKPFSYNLWTLLSILLLSGVIAIQILRFMRPSSQRLVFGEGNSSPVGNLLALSLGYSVTQPPRRDLARYLLMLWLLVTLIIRSAYQGALYDAIRMDKFVKIPSGYDDLMDWNYKILLSPDIAHFNDFFKNQTVLVDSPDFLERLQKLEQMEGNFATITLKDYYMHYMGTMHQRGSDLIMLDEVVYMSQIGMFLQRNAMFLQVFNRKLEAFMYSGIIGYIRSQVNNERFIVARKTSKKPITYERIQAVYEIYAVMVTLAILAFCVELASIYSARLQRIIEWIR